MQDVDNMSVKDRLVSFINYKRIGQRKFELSIGVSNGYINNLKSQPRDEILQKILHTYKDLNDIWLLTGKGNMLNNQVKIEDTQKTTKERLISFLKYKNLNMSEFARRIGVSNAFVNSIRKSIQPDKIISIANNFPDLNIEWLLTGEGEMLKEDSAEKVNENEYKPIVPLNLYQETNVNLNDYMRRHRSQLSFSHTVYSISNYDCVYTVITEAMIPNIKAGDRLALKRMEHGATIINGVVYVLDTISNGLLLRLLYDEPSEPDNYICRAFNERYTEISIKKNDVFDVYKVVGLLRASII